MRKVPVGQDVRADILARGTPGLLRRRPGQPGQRGGAVRRAPQRRAWSRWSTSSAPRTRSSWAPSASPWSCPRRAPQHGLPRGRPCAGRRAAAQDRPGAQGHHHPARPRAGRDDAAAREATATAGQGAHAEPRSGAVWRRIAEEVFMHQMTTGASNDFERAPDRPRHGHALRHDRRARPHGLRRERGRGLPRPLGHQDHQHVRGDHAKVDGEIRRIIDEQYAWRAS